MPMPLVPLTRVWAVATNTTGSKLNGHKQTSSKGDSHLT